MWSMSYSAKRYDFKDKAADYARLREELAALLAGEADLIANAANTSALIFDALPDINWAGFYFLKGGELVVGPFQGTSPATPSRARRSSCHCSALMPCSACLISTARDRDASMRTTRGDWKPW